MTVLPCLLITMATPWQQLKLQRVQEGYAPPQDKRDSCLISDCKLA